MSKRGLPDHIRACLFDLDGVLTQTAIFPGEVEVIGDRERLRQVTDNLLAHVRTHAPVGAAASVTARLAGGRAIVEVADSGPGIDPEDVEHIFERFFRSDPSRTRDRRGWGLGLSIVAAVSAAQ